MLKKIIDNLSSHVTVWTWAWPYASGPTQTDDSTVWNSRPTSLEAVHRFISDGRCTFRLSRCTSGVLGFGIVSGLIAKATAWVAPWGPIGWWFAGLVGALLAALLLLFGAIIYSKISDTRLKRRVYGQNDKLNPLESHFKGKRIKIHDLVLPFDPIIRRKTFEDCDIIGPYNVIS